MPLVTVIVFLASNVALKSEIMKQITYVTLKILVYWLQKSNALEYKSIKLGSVCTFSM